METNAKKLSPITREEVFLKNIADKLSGGGGGGEVTPASVASAIGSMNSTQKASARVALDAGLTPLRVNVDSEDDFSANYSQAEILTAIDARRPVRVLVDIGTSTAALLTTLAYDDSTGILEASGTGMMPDGTLVSVVYTLDSNDVGNLIVDPLQKGPFVVELTPTEQDMSGHMNKTVQEIFNAYSEGQEIRFVLTVPNVARLEMSLASVTYDPEYSFPSFNFFVLDVENNLLIYGYTGYTDSAYHNAYATKFYALTPA